MHSSWLVRLAAGACLTNKGAQRRRRCVQSHTYKQAVTASTTVRQGRSSPSHMTRHFGGVPQGYELPACLGAGHQVLMVVKSHLLPPVPVALPDFTLGLECLAYLRPRTVGKWAGRHLLGITWRWDSAGAGDEGQLASAAWSRPGWQGSPRLWESE